MSSVTPSGEQPLFRESELPGLLDWFDRGGIDYPWGDNPTPYRVWVSEIMLQQTVVTAAINHFTRWMELFPTVEDLAGADEQSVLKAWEGLGYYSRARNLRKGAIYLVGTHEGRLPEDYKSLLKVPGIGDYTARAVLSLAFGRAYPVLDANVRRIAQRLRSVRDWQKGDDVTLMESLEKLIPPSSPGLFNCALMQLGQQVCRVRSPECGICPLRESCISRKLGVQGEIPAPKKRKIKEKKTVLCLLLREGKILLVRRDSGIGRGLWFVPALPAGKEAEILSSLESSSLTVSPASESSAEDSGGGGALRLKERVHLYTSWKEHLDPRLFITDDDSFPSWLPVSEDEYRWVELSALSGLPTASVYRKILDDLSRYISDP